MSKFIKLTQDGKANWVRPEGIESFEDKQIVFYGKAQADMTVDQADMTVDQTAKEIAKLLSNSGFSMIDNVMKESIIEMVNIAQLKKSSTEVFYIELDSPEAGDIAVRDKLGLRHLKEFENPTKVIVPLVGVHGNELDALRAYYPHEIFVMDAEDCNGHSLRGFYRYE